MVTNKTRTIIIVMVLLVVIGYLFTNNYYIEYKKEALASNFKCEGDKIVKAHWLQAPAESECSLECYKISYSKQEEEVICINNIPTCICKATLYNSKIKPFIFNN